MSAESHGIPKISIATPRGIRGKGNNLKNLFRRSWTWMQRPPSSSRRTSRASPVWIRNLGEPLFKDFAFVSPLYVRHKYDGTITNNIAYPLSRCLYGRRVRQPIGGDCGLSSQMARGSFSRAPCGTRM